MPQREPLPLLQSLTALLLVIVVSGVCFAKFPTYFSSYRNIQGVMPYRQNYVVLDDQILSNSRHDLGDLRVFADSQEVPFELVTERGDNSLGHAQAKILSRKRLGGETQFVFDITGLPQCDRMDLTLADSARDFVSEARVEGLRSPTERIGANLGSSVLFDLSREGLGSGATLEFPMTRDPYLRVTLTRLAPEQLLQAVAVNSQIGNPQWTALGGELPVTQEGQSTVVTWDASEEAPVMRLVFKVDPSQTNFWRDVEVLTPGGGTITNRSVRRIRLIRDGKQVQSEWLDLTLPSEEWGAFRLVFHDGNELPIKITSARAYAWERRVYFNPQGRTSVALLYGSSRLAAPQYAHLPPLSNTGETDAVATLGPEMQNPERAPEGNEIKPSSGDFDGIVGTPQIGIASSTTPTEIAEAEGLIEQFAESHDPSDLQKAFSPLTVQLKVMEARPVDPQMIMLWLRLFSVVDAAHLELSKEFRIPVNCSGPPDYPPGSAPDPCGSPPETMTDATLRRQYESALAENAGAAQTALNYGRIRRLKDQLDLDFWSWANGLYRQDADSETRLLNEARAAGCSEARVEWIRDITEAPSGAFPPNESIVFVPTKLKITPAGGQISIRPVFDFLHGVQLVLDNGRTMGIETDLRIYAEGSERPSQPDQIQILSMSEFAEGTGPETILTAGQSGLPQSSRKHVVEEDLTIFETDIPTQHTWAPKDSPNYRVLWHGILSQAVD